jgi:hypothetical protein
VKPLSFQGEERAKVRQIYVDSVRVQMIIAAIIPGIQASNVKTTTSSIEPQPLSKTAAGGKRIQTMARNRLMLKNSFLGREPYFQSVYYPAQSRNPTIPQ